MKKTKREQMKRLKKEYIKNDELEIENVYLYVNDETGQAIITKKKHNNMEKLFREYKGKKMNTEQALEILISDFNERAEQGGKEHEKTTDK